VISSAWSSRRAAFVAAVVALGWTPGCLQRPSEGEDLAEIGEVEAPGGERAVESGPQGVIQRATLREDGVVDGDTLRAVGFDQSIRLLCIDTEETLEGEDLEAALRDWEAYRREKTEGAENPVSYGTFLGNEATEFAERFFEGVDEIYVEYQSAKKTREYFGRHLGYVWIRDGEDGAWTHYNVEAVRAGMSPYFTSYGWCDDHDEAFRQAQAEAREARRGIWAEGARGYDDYEERIARWERRARQIGLYREHFEGRPRTVKLGTDTALSRLRLYVGERVTVFGALARVVPGGDPPRLEFFHRHREPVAVVFDEGMAVDDAGVELEVGQYYYVEGIVEMYRGNPRIRLDRRGFVRSGAQPPR
jgi:endonuclease YncB( thermonuclease family)